jgi:hypothetical protein
LVFKGLSIIGQRPVNINIPAPKIGAFQKNNIFSKNDPNDVSKCQLNMETISLNKTTKVFFFFRKKVICTVATQMRNVDLVRTGFTS